MMGRLFSKHGYSMPVRAPHS